MKVSRHGSHLLACVLLCILTTLHPGARAAPSDGFLGLLRSELQRNLDVLRKEPVAPYFASYTVHDTHETGIVTSFGALLASDDNQARTGAVELRAGDYALDSTHPLRSGQTSNVQRPLVRVRLALGGDDMSTRASLWRATDRAFRQAVEALTRVKANVASQVAELDPATDFSKEQPETYVGSPAAQKVDVKSWEERLRHASAPFAEDPLILQGNAALDVQGDTRYFVNSEGAAILTGQTRWQLSLQAVTKAADGMELPLYTSYFATTPEGLPSESRLIADAQQMVALLGRLRQAPIVEPYTGPAMLSGRAAGVFFHEIFGHRIEGHRQKNVTDAQTFAKRVGQPVLPDFLTVVFDPTRERLGNRELLGHYVYDDEGVKSRPVTVVNKGILETFLLSRAPLSAFPQSNGHGRAQPGLAPVSRQSNLIVQSGRTVSRDRLLEMLKDEVRKQGKPFGLVFENIEGGFTLTGRTSPNAFNVLPNVVFRIYPDNRAPELVRGVDLIGTPLSAFGKIVATSDEVDVFNGMCGAESGSVPVSASAPAMLVSEVEVQKKAQSQDTPPILPPPAARKKS